MYGIKKRKVNLKKKLFYYFLFLLFIFILSYTIYFLSAMIINTKMYDNIKNTNLRNGNIVKWMTGKIISYIINSFLSIFFLVYLLLGRKRIEFGFFFIVIWIMLFIAIISSTYIIPGARDEIIRSIFAIISSIAGSFIVLGLLILFKQVIDKRKYQKKEMYNTFKKRKGERCLGKI